MKDYDRITKRTSDGIKIKNIFNEYVEPVCGKVSQRAIERLADLEDLYEGKSLCYIEHKLGDKVFVISRAGKAFVICEVEIKSIEINQCGIYYYDEWGDYNNARHCYSTEEEAEEARKQAEEFEKRWGYIE